MQPIPDSLKSELYQGLTRRALFQQTGMGIGSLALGWLLGLGLPIPGVCDRVTVQRQRSGSSPTSHNSV
mgnify:CR=1 FL=1